MNALLKISNFSIFLKDHRILDNINIDVFEGEILALVGESGSGKSMLARSILRLNSPDVFKTGGKILFEGKDINSLPERQLTGIRGCKIGMVFQEPLSYLNPVFKMGGQLTEPLKKHKQVDKKHAVILMEELLLKLKIKQPQAYMRSYPHQLSGGMAQRGVIAMVSSCGPRLIIADEPTSSLDVITQASIIRLIKDLASLQGVSVVFITHDLELALKIADRAVVISNGTIVEEGVADKVLNNPESKAAIDLLSASLDSKHESKKTQDKKSRAIVEVKDLKMYYNNGKNVDKALDGITLELYEGETLGILGESGCGKSTLARILTRIQKPLSGDVLFEGMDVFKLKNYPKNVQMVFQDPSTSIDPQMRVEDIIAEGMDVFYKKTHEERTKEVVSCLKRVGLDTVIKDRFPHELSGGQRQRVGIARALIMKPKVLICDEPTSYLDRVSQITILDLFMKLKEEVDLTYLFITHNIRILSRISDRIAIMYRGRIVETGKRDDVINNPIHPYTSLLIKAALTDKDLHPELILKESDKNQLSGLGCSFHSLCHKAKDKCRYERPDMIDSGGGHCAACHYP